MGIKPEELKLKSGCFGAEPWTEEMRQHLEDLLDFDALDIYGLTEIGGPGVAFECMESMVCISMKIMCLQRLSIR